MDLDVIAELAEDDVERVLRALQHAGEGHVKMQAAILEDAAGPHRFDDALVGEAGVAQTREDIALVPLALAVPHEH